MHLEIVTPETKIFAGDVEAVQFPGIDGLFQVLNNHAPIISALGKGIIKIDLNEAFERTEKSSSLIEEDKNPKMTYHSYVRQKHNNFFTKLVTCAPCLNFWIVLLIVILFNSINIYPLVYILSYALYKILKKYVY